ncbi:hypothetical protein IDM40_08635 [Nocardiopsis sp. HNM0947]|uniref:Uncharacterized protein n=1 Tax=Nocardiopsis coralli TaxID=2772213 RepID=A0ABR9P4M9_9ACTN|nr:hypothetical protein [Nocardiopsis coralli]MBE2998767.1 hypothetical protein [Nocardiopsis coralli]
MTVIHEIRTLLMVASIGLILAALVLLALSIRWKRRNRGGGTWAERALVNGLRHRLHEVAPPDLRRQAARTVRRRETTTDPGLGRAVHLTARMWRLHAEDPYHHAALALLLAGTSLNLVHIGLGPTDPLALSLAGAPGLVLAPCLLLIRRLRLSRTETALEQHAPFTHPEDETPWEPTDTSPPPRER